MHARLRGPNNLLIIHQIINRTCRDFPSLADEIAEPRPGVSTKVAAFTVSEKSINTNIIFILSFLAQVYNRSQRHC